MILKLQENVAKASDQKKRLEAVNCLLSRQDCTFLGVGPMSKNCTDAAIELANERKTPIMLIASRRQVECLELGGGYVNNWDTISFANYVREKDLGGFIILARDHGGPWQHPLEVERYSDLEDALESACLSYQRDIEAGFQILHIDPVIANSSEHVSTEWVLQNIFKLYDFCMRKAQELGREVYFEIGTEEQKQNPLQDSADLVYVLDRLNDFCAKKNYPKPIFLVVQTGTKVMETRNIGRFPQSKDEIQSYVENSNLSKFVAICNEYGIKLKEHNTDYLPNESLLVHTQLGIHAANVAPEFGVAETKEIIRLCRAHNLDELLSHFLEASYASKKWEKWIISPDLSREEKAIIAGHYVFSKPEVRILFNEMRKALKSHGVDFDLSLKNAVKSSIARYLDCFKL